MSVNDLVSRLKDPSLTWNVAVSFGGKYVRRQAISTSNPQTLHVCDDIICIPTRFSEYFYWHDGNGNLVSRIFPNHEEAWDHANETNPNTLSPYDGKLDAVIGYSGYILTVDLTDGTTKTTVRIVKRNYPELQILIVNLGTLTVRVNDPPAGFGLRYTTGTPGTEYVDLGQNQYVVYYKTTQPSIDTTNLVFAQSPLGTTKVWDYELYVRRLPYHDLGFNLYLGIRTLKDTLADSSIIPILIGGSNSRGGINISGYDYNCLTFNVYDSDPYCSQGTFAGRNIIYASVVGFATDENNNLKFSLITNLLYKHTTKVEQRGKILVVLLYDAGLDEYFTIRIINPLANMYSYGQGGATILPYTLETILSDDWEFHTTNTDAQVSRAIDPADSILEWTTKPATTWTYYNAYALMNCYDASNDCRASVMLGIYTDDTEVSIPADVRQAFAVGGHSSFVKRFGIQVKPFMDRTIYAGKTYAVLTRVKTFPRTATGTDLQSWAKKKYPVKLTDTEWSGLLSVLPLTKDLAGGKPVEGTYTILAPSTATPGSTITVSGSTPRTNANVKVVLIDPDTYTVIASNTGVTDSNGNYSVNLTIPSTATLGKTYKIYVVVG